MKKEPLHSFALDREHHLVHVNDAIKGKDYYCPGCGAQILPRQGQRNEWHFAHKNNPENCSYETYLHKLAKRRIRECFDHSPHFTITFYPEFTCSVAECPLGLSRPCTWHEPQTFELTDYYNTCEEEASIGRYRADLLLTNSEKKDRESILIEICVTHKCTQKKIKSDNRIIEIHIDSEEDIEQIVSNAAIKESGEYESRDWRSDGKVRFYNFKFKNYKKIPNETFQEYKFRFWIDEKGYFQFDKIDELDDSVKCLSPNSPNVDSSKFLIQSNRPISWDFAFQKISQSGTGIKYCTMCDFYRMNDRYGKCMCILYKSKGTKQFPHLSAAHTCQHFRQINYSRANRMFEIDQEQECRITTNTPK